MSSKNDLNCSISSSALSASNSIKFSSNRFFSIVIATELEFLIANATPSLGRQDKTKSSFSFLVKVISAKKVTNCQLKNIVSCHHHKVIE